MKENAIALACILTLILGIAEWFRLAILVSLCGVILAIFAARKKKAIKSRGGLCMALLAGAFFTFFAAFYSYILSPTGRGSMDGRSAAKVASKEKISGEQVSKQVAEALKSQSSKFPPGESQTKYIDAYTDSFIKTFKEERAKRQH